MKLDIHVHLVAHKTPAHGRLSPAFKGSVVFKLMQRLLGMAGIDDPAAMDAAYLERLLRLVDAAPSIDAVVALGMDGVYDGTGRLDEERTEFMVTNRAVVEACEVSEGRLLPGWSVNPMARDAVDRLHEAREAGALLIKLIPSTQRVDLSDRAFLGYYRALRDLRLPLLVHIGREHTLPSVRDGFYNRAEQILPALDEGVTVIVAHGGIVAEPFKREESQKVLALMEEYPLLHVDMSGNLAPNRIWRLRSFFERRHLHHRILHGSDYPVLVMPRLLTPWIGSTAWHIARTYNDSPLERDVQLKLALGMPEGILDNAARILGVN